jgi:hypothetical protein
VHTCCSSVSVHQNAIRAKDCSQIHNINETIIIEGKEM